jgi:transcriptional regulator with XRE-family HTH domain
LSCGHQERLAGISVEYYTRLERGNANGASEDVLEGITRALQLDEAEHAHLFDLVRTANTTRPARRRPTPERVRPSVQRILDAESRCCRRGPGRTLRSA